MPWLLDRRFVWLLVSIVDVGFEGLIERLWMDGLMTAQTQTSFFWRVRGLGLDMRRSGSLLCSSGREEGI